MKKMVKFLATAMAAVLMVGCTSTFLSSAGFYDDLYATHDTNAIAARQRAEAEARRAEAAAQQAQWEAEAARYEAEAAREQASSAQRLVEQSYRTDSDGIIIVEDEAAYTTYSNPYRGYVADSYESAYARRLRGFKSASYRMPSSYYNLRYGGAYTYVTAYDPAYYNIMVAGDQVWVEPKYITSMFGTWGAANATVYAYSPWYYGWTNFDPWYYSWWGYPHYSWYDWNWNICYRSHWGWGIDLWWGCGGYYHPYYYSPYWGHHHHNHYWGSHHHGGHHGPDYWGGPRYDNRYYGSRGNSQRIDGNKFSSNGGTRGTINRGSGRSTPYRSPSTGNVYGQGGSRGNNSSATVNRGGSTTTNRTPGSVSRGQGGSASRGSGYTSGSSSSRGTSGTSYNSGSSTSRGSGTSYRGGSSSRGGR